LIYLTAETLIFSISFIHSPSKCKGSIFLDQYKIVFLIFDSQVKRGEETDIWTV